MGKALFTNNATATLASPVATAIATTAVLTASQGALFPAPSGGNYFYATLVDASNNKEIVKVTANAADTFTMVRGQEGTTALTFAAGSRVELRPTAAGLTEKVATGDINATVLTALAGAPTGTGSVVLSAAPTITGHPTIEGVTSTGATGTGKLAYSASPTFTGTLNAADINASGTVAGVTLAISGNGTVDQLGVHTAVGGWAGNAIFETLSGGGAAVSAYNILSGGMAFCGRVDATPSYLARWQYGTVGFVGSITTDGATTAYNTTCDARLKANIQDAVPSGAIIDTIQVRSWDWKANNLHQPYGFVAQELAVLVPSAVHVGDDDPEEVTREWAVDYAKLVPLLVKEIQSLRARLAAAGL